MNIENEKIKASQNPEQTLFQKYDLNNNFLLDIGYLIQIIVPVIILFIGIHGLFAKTISEEQANRLIFAGSLSTGLNVKK